MICDICRRQSLIIILIYFSQKIFRDHSNDQFFYHTLYMYVYTYIIGEHKIVYYQEKRINN